MTKSLGPAARLRQHFSDFFCNGFSLVCFYDHCFSHSVLQWLFLLVVFSSKVEVLFHQVVLCSSDNHVNSLKTRVSSSNSNWRVKTILFWPRKAGAISETCRLHLSVWPPSYKTVLIHMEITFQIIRSLVEESSIFFFNWGIRNCLTVHNVYMRDYDSPVYKIALYMLQGNNRISM